LGIYLDRIRKGWKGAKRTHALAYLTSSSVVKESLVRLTIIVNGVKLFSSSLTAILKEPKLFSLVNLSSLIFVIKALVYLSGAPLGYPLG
jgi:hypothetical protein